MNNNVNYIHRGIHADYYYRHVMQVLVIFQQPSIFSPAQHNDTPQLIPSDPRTLDIVIFGCTKIPTPFLNTGNLHEHEGALSIS